jgi:hypothetical protein
MQGEIRITVIATGFDQAKSIQSQAVQGIQPVAMPIVRPAAPTHQTVVSLPTTPAPPAPVPFSGNGSTPSPAISAPPSVPEPSESGSPDIPNFLRHFGKK